MERNFLRLEAISASPDFVTNTLIPITKSRLKDKEKTIRKNRNLLCYRIFTKAFGVTKRGKI